MTSEAPTSDASLRALAAVIAGLHHAPDTAQAAGRCVEALLTALGAVRAVALLATGEDRLQLAAGDGFEVGSIAPFTADAVEAWLEATLGPGHLRAALPAPSRGLLAAAPAAVTGTGTGDVQALHSGLRLLAAALATTVESLVRNQRLARPGGDGSAGAGPRRDDLRLALRGLSHDIRSPLQAVLMQHSLLASGGLGELTREQQQTLQNMRQGLDGIRDMARAAWDASRVLGGDLDLAPAALDVTDLVASVTDAARPAVEGRGHALDSAVEPGLQVVADATAATRILCALLDNAAKFAPPPAHIVLQARSAAGIPGRVTVSVTDSGPGVTEALGDGVFDPYVRAACGDGAPGNGLGLTVARALARAMDGELALERREGRLACFALHLPAA